MTPAEQERLALSGLSAKQIAAQAGVNVRTAYKWLTRWRTKPDAPALPENFDRAALVEAAIDAAVADLRDGSAAAVERLLNLARAAQRLHALALAKSTQRLNADRDDMRARILEKLNMASSEATRQILAAGPPTPPAEPETTPPEPETAPQAAPPPAPVENPWLASLKIPRDPRQGARVTELPTARQTGRPATDAPNIPLPPPLPHQR